MSCSLTILPGLHAAPQQSWRDVERDDLVGGLQERERDDLANRIADQRFCSRRDRFEVLDVEGADDADPALPSASASCQRLACGALAEIVVREFVEQQRRRVFSRTAAS